MNAAITVDFFEQSAYDTVSGLHLSFIYQLLFKLNYWCFITQQYDNERTQNNILKCAI